ncbi:hypothetical protein T484DRAFT_1788832, partial [Baffinella frigidus]
MSDPIDVCLALAEETCQILADSPLTVPAQSVAGATEEHHSTIGLMLQGTKVTNLLPGAPAALSKQIHKGDTILTVDGQDATTGNIIDLLQNPDEPGTMVMLSIKGEGQGAIFQEVMLRRMATVLVADKRHLFDLFTKIRTASKSSGEATIQLVDEALETWTKMDEFAEARWHVIADNVRDMQESSRTKVAKIEETLQALKAGGGKVGKVGKVEADGASKAEAPGGPSATDEMAQAQSERDAAVKARETAERALRETSFQLKEAEKGSSAAGGEVAALQKKLAAVQKELQEEQNARIKAFTDSETAYRAGDKKIMEEKKRTEEATKMVEQMKKTVEEQTKRADSEAATAAKAQEGRCAAEMSVLDAEEDKKELTAEVASLVSEVAALQQQSSEEAERGQRAK